jgi:hypothetical protein
MLRNGHAKQVLARRTKTSILASCAKDCEEGREIASLYGVARCIDPGMDRLKATIAQDKGKARLTSKIQ